MLTSLILWFLCFAEAGELLDINEEFAPINSAVIVIGGSGSGKDALVKILTADAETEDIAILPTNQTYLKNSIHHPVLFSDNSSGLHFYNCPVVSIARGPVAGFAVDFFMTKMFHSVNNVQFLFVMNWNYLTKLNSTKPYSDLMGGISQLIPDLDRFQDSMFLTATNAPDKLSREEIIHGIHDFLSEMDSLFQQQAGAAIDFNSRGEALRHKRITNLFQNRTRLCISWNDPGVQFVKREILRILKSNPYTELRPGDIGPVLSPKSRNRGQEVTQ